MALSNAARRRLASLRASGVSCHTDAELGRMAKASAPKAAAPVRARVAAPKRARAHQSCGLADCIDGCHDCM